MSNPALDEKRKKVSELSRQLLNATRELFGELKMNAVDQLTGFNEKVKTTGDKLVQEAKQLAQKGAHVIIVENEQGKEIARFPLLFGGIIAIGMPVITALTVLGATLGRCTIKGAAQKTEENSTAA